jgi:FeS assembly SUF system regulator
MIKMGKLTDYGTLIMTFLAREPGSLHAAQEIAHAVGISLPTATKVLKMLARAGLLESQRGTRGGYSLSRSPEDITMADVISALEGPIGLTECGTSSQPGNCNRARSCSVKTNWQRISQAVNDALAGVTLAEMTVPAHPIHFTRQPVIPSVQP